MAPSVVILVPRRADGGHRDRLWEFCRSWWERCYPDIPIIEGHHDDGPFNRSAAVNRAAAAAGAWDVALIIDSDIIPTRTAVADAVEVAHATGRLVVSHHDRVMLNRAGTDRVLDGYDGPWRERKFVERIYTDSVSCCIAVPRSAWDAAGGFDERFVGWLAEDSAFVIAVETLTGKPMVRLASELFHLHHPLAPESPKDHPLRVANTARLDAYRAAAGDPAAVRALLAEPVDLPPSRIPRILHRTVPEQTTDEVEGWWQRFADLHPGWDLRTHREPLDPADWPLTGDLFDRCANGAQRAGLIRLECLVTWGGFYADSDVEPFRSLEPLLHCSAVAAWEDSTTVPDAVLGAEPNHPAFVACMEKARAVIEGGGDAHQSGPGVTTETLPNRSDVLVLPPGSFYPYHYLAKNERDAATPEACPWAFVAHHWHGSWLSDGQRKSIEKRQRR